MGGGGGVNTLWVIHGAPYPTVLISLYLTQLTLLSTRFPVESMVIRPTDGAVVHRVNANDLLHGGKPPSNETGSLFGAMSM